MRIRRRFSRTPTLSRLGAGRPAAGLDAMHEELVSAAIRPVEGTIDTARMGTGAPGLPRQFTWGSQTIQIARVLKTWRETGPCHHGSGEKYVRKHWFEVLTDSGDTLKIYFERQARSRSAKARWWLYSIATDKEPPRDA